MRDDLRDYVVEDRGVGYVLAVACSHQVSTSAGKRRADELAASLPRHTWQRVSAGPGSKGPRCYDWAWVTINAKHPGQRWLLIRRNNSTGELAYYRCHAPEPVPLHELVRVAGRRWTVEESFQASKGLTGLDPAPGPPLGFLAPLDRAGHARLRLPRRARRRRTRPQPGAGRADPADLQRDPPPVQRAHRRTDQRSLAPVALVDLAKTTPAPRQGPPLPATNRDRTVKITIYGCRTRSAKLCSPTHR